MSEQVLLETGNTVDGFKVGDKLVKQVFKQFLGEDEDKVYYYTIYKINGATLYTKSADGTEYSFKKLRTKTAGNKWRTAGEFPIAVSKFIRA